LFNHEETLSLVANAIDYTLIITSFTDANGCIGIPFAPFDLKVNEAPIISLNAFIPSEICETHSITLNIGTPINTSIDAPPYTVTLNGTETHFLNNDGTETSGANIGNLITLNPNNAGVYPYTITFFKDGNGCGIIDPLNNTTVLKVNETADMIVTSTADTGAICMGEKAYINLDFTAGTSPWVVKFLKDGNLVTLPPYSNNNITIPQGIYKNITSYEFVSVNDSNTCINDPYNKQFDVIANSLPVVELTVDGSRYICDDGSTTNIEFNFLDGKPIYKVNYSVGLDNRYFEFNSPNPPTIPTDESGLWKITKVIDGNNCEANVLGKEVLIQVNPLPYPVEFVAYPQPADINNPFIQFIDNSVGHITAIWNFNDGAAPDTLSNNLKWLHEFDAVPDTHLVVLQVISDSGCINSTTQTVIIHEAFSCFIPNSFSPNNDMYNDFYMPITSRVQEYKLSIFDRLGNRVFETNKYSDVYCMYGCDEAWDGTVNDSGEYATTGIYIYSIEIIDHNGKERNFEGKINLVR
jgi:gliding motility-associated-like protein